MRFPKAHSLSIVNFDIGHTVEKVVILFITWSLKAYPRPARILPSIPKPPKAKSP